MKKLLSIILIILLALSAAGCGEEGVPFVKEEASFQTGQPSQQELIESLRGEPIQFTDDLFIHPIPYAKPGDQLTDEEAAAIGESLIEDSWVWFDRVYVKNEIGYDPERVIEQEEYHYGKAKYYDSLEEEVDILSRLYSRDCAEALASGLSLMREDGLYLRLEAGILSNYGPKIPLEITPILKEEKRLVIRAHMTNVITFRLFVRENEDLIYEILEQDGYWVLKSDSGERPLPEQVYQPKEVYSYPRRTQEIQVQDDAFIHPISYAKPGDLLHEEEVVEMFESLMKDAHTLIGDYFFGWKVNVNPEDCRVEEGKNWYKLNYFQTAAEFEGAFASIFSRYFARRTAGQVVRYSRYREWDGELYFTPDIEMYGYLDDLDNMAPKVVSQEMHKLVIDWDSDSTTWRYTLVVEDGRWVIEDFAGEYYKDQENETASGEIPQGGLD